MIITRWQKIIQPEFLKSSAFLLSLIIIIFINPFLDESLVGRLIASLLVVATMAGAFGVMFSHRSAIWFVLVLVGFSILAEVLSWTFANHFFIEVIYSDRSNKCFTKRF